VGGVYLSGGVCSGSGWLFWFGSVGVCSGGLGVRVVGFEFDVFGCCGVNGGLGCSGVLVFGVYPGGCSGGGVGGVVFLCSVVL
jgi:hypothetical protein